MELPALIHPQHLLWLLPVLPLLWWLARPPRPRRTLVTAHRAQWLLAQATLRRRTPRFRALRWWLLCAATVGVAIAHAAPRQRGEAGPQRLLVLLDGSASMAATLGGETRFAAAVALVRQRLLAVPMHVDVEVVELGAAPRRWQGAAARALLEPGEPGGPLPAPLAELAAAAADAGTAVWTVTDGQGGDLPAAGALSCLGGSGANVSLLAVQVQDHWPLPELELAVDVQNFGPPVEVRLEAAGAVSAPVQQRVPLAAGERRLVPFALRRAAAGGRLTVTAVAPADLLASDDAWTADLLPLPAPRVAVLADDRGGPYVRAAAEALAVELGGEVVDSAPGQSAGYLLVEGGSAALAPGSAAMATFGVLPPGVQAQVWPSPTVLDWDRRDPLLAGLDLSELWVEHALLAALPPGRALLWGTAPDGATAPLCVLAEGPQAQSLHCAFRLQDSNLPLLPAFPQLLRRLLLAGHRVTESVRAASAGVPAAEADLRQAAAAADRALPAFGAAGRDLAPWLLLAAVCLLAGRACLR